MIDGPNTRNPAGAGWAQTLSCLAADDITNNPILTPRQVRPRASDFVGSQIAANEPSSDRCIHPPGHWGAS